MADAHPVERGTVFDAVAERYAARRPTYPEPLFDALAAYGGLQHGSRVLEIAPGTGQATAAMARRGWVVTAVERGPVMAALASRALAGSDAEVVVSAFEDWPPLREPFDAVVCATAWHWIDPVVRLFKAAEALRSGGALAIIRTHHVAGGSQGFFERAQECYPRFDPEVTEPHVLPSEESLRVRVDELEDPDLVTDVEQHLFASEVAYDRQGFTELLSTYSGVAAMGPADREALLGCLGAPVDDGRPRPSLPRAGPRCAPPWCGAERTHPPAPRASAQG